MISKLLFYSLLLLVRVALLVTAQVPAVCTDQTSLSAKECCPLYKGKKCGGLVRGECVTVSMLCNTGYNKESLPSGYPMDFTDERFNWPSKIFDKVCQCKGNYAGYDCSECQFGYGGNNCTSKLPVRYRKSVADDNVDWPLYRNQLNMAKYTNSSRYKVYTGGAINAPNSYKNVSLYNLFAWIHHYAARTAKRTYSKMESAYDYAHNSVGFLTWHRLYLLWFEREMRLLLKDDTFTLRYWNWTNESDRDILFNSNALGGIGENGAVISATFGEQNWKPVCWDGSSTPLRTVCDPERVLYKRIIRCTNIAECQRTGDHWPTATHVDNALNFTLFRKPNNIHNKYDKDSFSNYLEGFDSQTSCVEGKDICGTEEPKIPRRLHNVVHLLLGGTMLNVAGSPNDPVFLNHHTMIDCLFEQWLRRGSDRSPYPSNLNAMFAGHGGGDCIVPFFPLYNHSYIYSHTSSDFGYTCGAMTTGAAVAVLTSMLIFALMI